MDNIVVAGYPRSGNVWLSRLLGDVLNCRVVGIKGGRDSLAAEGGDRPNECYVKQAHYWVCQRFPDKHEVKRNLCTHPQRHRDCTFIQIIRDPRDVAVSASKYWKWGLEDTIGRMIDGPGPLELPPWAEFVESWFGLAPMVRYEDLVTDAERVVQTILDWLEREPEVPIADAVHRQTFMVKKVEMYRNGGTYPFGKKAQLRHLRHGSTGDWKEHFTQQQAEWARDAWNDWLLLFGYEKEEA